MYSIKKGNFCQEKSQTWLVTKFSLLIFFSFYFFFLLSLLDGTHNLFLPFPFFSCFSQTTFSTERRIGIIERHVPEKEKKRKKGGGGGGSSAGKNTRQAVVLQLEDDGKDKTFFYQREHCKEKELLFICDCFLICTPG